MTSKTLAMCFWPRVRLFWSPNEITHHLTHRESSSHSLPIPIRISMYAQVSMLLLLMEARKFIPTGVCEVVERP